MEVRAASTGDGVPTLPYQKRRPLALFAALLVATLVLLMLSPLIGNVPIPPLLDLEILVHQLSNGWLIPDACGGIAAGRCTIYTEIIWEGRLPEILLAALAGAGLALSGGTLQGVFRNPLADPFLLGLSSGGALGAAVVIVLHVGQAQENLVLPLFAFVGSLCVALVILVVSSGRRTSIETLLLTGVALSSFLTAILSLLLIYGPIETQELEFWLLGGLGSATWDVDGIVLAPTLLVGIILASQGRELNLLQLGPEVAGSMGVRVTRVRTRLIMLAAIVTAVAVAFTGIIGFVGLVSPHVIRRLGSTDYRVVLPGSALFGAVFLILARDASLLAFPSIVVPIGIFTAFAGVPFFLYLLYRRRSSTLMGGGG
jgi:iron complex transport system permease protein